MAGAVGSSPAIPRGAWPRLGRGRHDARHPHGPRWRIPGTGRLDSADGGIRRHSSDLRSGLAATIALLGAFGDDVEAGYGNTGTAFAGSLVRGHNVGL